MDNFTQTEMRNNQRTYRTLKEAGIDLYIEKESKFPWVWFIGALCLLLLGV